MSLKEEKQEVLKGLVSIMNEGLTNEDKLTYEMLKLNVMISTRSVNEYTKHKTNTSKTMYQTK